MAIKKYVPLTDAYLQAVWDFSRDDDTAARYVWDDQLRGFRARIGSNRVTFSYFRQFSDHGTRGTTFRKIGEWPQMKVVEARAAATVVAAERRRTGKAIKFADALQLYLEYLEAHKSPTTLRTVVQIGKALLLPRWEKWPLSEMSARPDLIAAWHAAVTRDHGPVRANRTAQVLRAIYKRAARLDRSLPVELPTSGITFNVETRGGPAVAFKDFPAWRRAWEQLDSPVHRSYHLTNLLTGCRPGELCRLRRDGIKPKERAFVIPHGKTGDIRVVLSVAIIRALKIALRAHSEELVFPGCHLASSKDALPARGMVLRRTYRTIAADTGADEMLSHFLMGHAPAGISQRYVARMILASGPAIRAAQRKISRRIVGLLGITL